MKPRLFFLIAAVVVCASPALGGDANVLVEYPVPALPMDGWTSASVTFQKFTTPDVEFTISSSDRYERFPTAVARRGVLKDNQPHKYSLSFHVSERRQDTSPLQVTVGRESRGYGDLVFGRSVVGLTSTRGIVKAREAQLDAIMGRPPDSWGGRTDIRIIEHRNAELLPRSWMGYDLLQAMLIEDFPYPALSGAQEDAIVQWVEKGGTLLVSPGKSGMAFRSSLLRRLVGFRVRGSETLSRPPDLGGGGLEGKVTFWDVEVENARHEAWAEIAPCGAGTVVIFRYDVLRAPFSQWSGLTNLFRRTCAIPAEARPRVKFPLHWSKHEESLPSARRVAAILGIYLLVAGPVNYLALRRRNKLVLMPFTIGGIALGFTLAIISYGYLSRGMSTELRELTLVRTYPGRTTAYAISQKGIYASSNLGFRMEFADSTGVRKLTTEEWREESPLGISDRGDGTLEVQFTSPMWEVFLMEAHAPVPEFGALRVETRDGATTVYNNTAADLEKCWAKLSGRWYDVGKLPRGGAAKNPTAVGKPPESLLRLVSLGGKEPIVLGQAAPDTDPAIPCKIAEGGGRVRQSETYIVGGAP